MMPAQCETIEVVDLKVGVLGHRVERFGQDDNSRSGKSRQE
jgi:hypothetical protein